MKDRIPLQIVEGRLVLTAVIECKKLRIQRQFLDFVVDTGSPESYIAEKDSLKLQIPTDREHTGHVDFGGSRYSIIKLPEFIFYVLKGDEPVQLNIFINALKSSKTSPEKIKISQALPSILGLDFLKNQKLSLHAYMTENLAYLEFET